MQFFGNRNTHRVVINDLIRYFDYEQATLILLTFDQTTPRVNALVLNPPQTISNGNTIVSLELFVELDLNLINLISFNC